MNINEIKDLMAQFDQSSLREFSYKNQSDELTFSKNEGQAAVPTASVAPIAAPSQAASAPVIEPTPQAAPSAEPFGWCGLLSSWSRQAAVCISWRPS